MAAVMTLSGRVRRLVRGRDGAELIEFALVMPLLMLVMAGILDAGFLFNNYQVVTNAAREGARVAAIPGWVEDDVKARVNAYVTGAGLQAGSVTTTVEPVAIQVGNRSINAVKVSVAYPYTYMILEPISRLVPGGTPLAGSVTVTGVATMRTEVAAGL
jgi:Flp pilus assembly protein TadG